jgi:hypothetical protein
MERAQRSDTQTPGSHIQNTKYVKRLEQQTNNDELFFPFFFPKMKNPDIYWIDSEGSGLNNFRDYFEATNGALHSCALGDFTKPKAA